MAEPTELQTWTEEAKFFDVDGGPIPAATALYCLFHDESIQVDWQGRTTWYSPDLHDGGPAPSARKEPEGVT